MSDAEASHAGAISGRGAQHDEEEHRVSSSHPTRREFLCTLPISLLMLQGFADFPALLESPRWAAVERLGTAMVAKRRFPGASLAVTRGGVLEFSGSWGHAALEAGRFATPGTRYRIASVTKTYIGVLFLRLARRGVLALDDPASRWLPEFPRSEEFTLRMLLNHTAGLAEYTRRPLDELAQDARRAYTGEEMLAYLSALRPLFTSEPGTAWSYSNTGYNLLGVAAERAAGAPLAELLEREVLAPAGLRETTWDADDDREVGRATGYGFQRAGLLRRGSWIRAPFVSSSYVGASGALRATARDVCVWYDRLFGGLLRSAEMEELLTAARLRDGRAFATSAGSGYGLGIWIGRTERGRVLWHSGSTAGFAADARHYPDLGVSIVMLGNADARRADSRPRRIRDAVFEALAA
jgi:D-alanyl-D-alanine carboxypeptidase